jgi:hypothetical protein
MAASLASVPELLKNTLSPNERSTSLLASFTCSKHMQSLDRNDNQARPGSLP